MSPFHIFRGVVMVEIDLNKTDINQCAQDDSLFSKSHKCYTETTQVKAFLTNTTWIKSLKKREKQAVKNNRMENIEQNKLRMVYKN